MSHGQENMKSNVPMDIDSISEYEQFELALVAANADNALALALQALEEATRASEEAHKRLQPMSHDEYKRYYLLENMPRSPTFRTRSQSLP